jgi:hypothetical protein
MEAWPSYRYSAKKKKKREILRNQNTLKYNLIIYKMIK